MLKILAVSCDLLFCATQEEKYVKPAAEIISDWGNLPKYISRIESTTWFYPEDLLDEHITGYKKWFEQQREEKKEDNQAKTD